MMGGGITAIWNDLSSARMGDPSSLTRTVTWLVVFASASAVIQEKTPATGSMVALAGAPSARLKVRAFGGRSESVAELEITRAIPAWMTWSGMAASTGGWLLSKTVTEKYWVTLRLGAPLSVTRTAME